MSVINCLPRNDAAISRDRGSLFVLLVTLPSSLSLRHVSHLLCFFFFFRSYSSFSSSFFLRVNQALFLSRDIHKLMREIVSRCEVANVQLNRISNTFETRKTSTPTPPICNAGERVVRVCPSPIVVTITRNTCFIVFQYIACKNFTFL